MSISTGTEHRNEAEAWGCPNWPHWQDAMVKEVSELTTKCTWEEVDAPPGINIVGSRWTYWLKSNANGNITCYKVHLVSQLFTQATRVDYSETFTLVAKFTSNCVVLALMAHNNWEVIKWR